MWKLTNIYAQNICAFREVDYSINQGVTTLIFGDNRDNESQRSNGSGKSALIECIAVGITGTPLRRAKGDEIINDDADVCFIQLDFENNSNKEVFTIERTIFRNQPSQVKLSIERDNKPVYEGVVQHSVDGYNKFILDKLGITKEEIFNSFILSKYRYENFLSVSDKDKKEIINRFSNGILVDEAIDKIQEDKKPCEENLRVKEMELAGLAGRIEILKEQIDQEENNKDIQSRNKAEKIGDIKSLIADKNEVIQEKKKSLTTHKRSSANLYDVDSALEKLENSEEPIEACVDTIKKIVDGHIDGQLTDWNNVIQSKKATISKLSEKIHTLDKDIELLGEKTNREQCDFLLLITEYDSYMLEHEMLIDSYHKNYQMVQSEMQSANDYLAFQGRNKRLLISEIEGLKNKLAGTITCPECNHQFSLTESGFDIEKARLDVRNKEQALTTINEDIKANEKQIETLETRQTELFYQKKALMSARDGWEEKKSNSERNLQQSRHQLERLKLDQQQLINEVVSIQEELGNIRRKVFDEIYSLIDDNFKKHERIINSLQDEIKSIEGSISTLEEQIITIEKSNPDEQLIKLKQSLKEHRQSASMVLQEKTDLESEINILSEQEQNFLHFKTYLANSKIEALNTITNEFLESIGSDIRINMSGYTVLKSGKIREKISVSLIRSGVDCGSFGKFSAGESARVNLATILAMQKLINSNCDVDKGLDLLVLDEILEAVDESGLANMFEALNKMGITSLVVSHGNIAESYPHTMLVVKENGESKIDC